MPHVFVKSWQTVVTILSTKTKYVAASDGTKEAIWICWILEIMGCELVELTILYEDNNSCQMQIENLLHHKQTKHIDIFYHFTKQMLEKEIVRMESVWTDDQVADIFTKPLNKVKF